MADDDAGMRRACRAMFESDGYEVVAAKDGADALAKFDAGRFDLVVLDVMMPKMNGLDACAEIRRRDALTPRLRPRHPRAVTRKILAKRAEILPFAPSWRLTGRGKCEIISGV